MTKENQTDIEPEEEEEEELYESFISNSLEMDILTLQDARPRLAKPDGKALADDAGVTVDEEDPRSFAPVTVDGVAPPKK